jgi:hypothetical protein
MIAPCRCRGLGVRFPSTILFHGFPTNASQRNLFGMDTTFVVTTAGSTPDVIPSCSSSGLFDVPGIWYQMESQGKGISVSITLNFKLLRMIAMNVAIDSGELSGTAVGASGGTPSNECYFDPSSPDVWFFLRNRSCPRSRGVFEPFVLVFDVCLARKLHREPVHRDFVF